MRSTTSEMEPSHPGGRIIGVREEMTGRITDTVLNKLQLSIKTNPEQGVIRVRKLEGNNGLQEMMARKLGRKSRRNSGKKRKTG